MHIKPLLYYDCHKIWIKTLFLYTQQIITKYTKTAHFKIGWKHIKQLWSDWQTLHFIRRAATTINTIHNKRISKALTVILFNRDNDPTASRWRVYCNIHQLSCAPTWIFHLTCTLVTDCLSFIYVDEWNSVWRNGRWFFVVSRLEGSAEITLCNIIREWS